MLHKNAHISRTYASKAAFGGAVLGLLVAGAAIASSPREFFASPYQLAIYFVAIPAFFAALGYASIYLFVVRFGQRIQNHRDRGNNRRRSR